MELVDVILQAQWQSLDELQSSSSEHEKHIISRLHALLTVESLTQGLESLDPNFSVDVIELTETEDYYSDNKAKSIQLCRKVHLNLSGQAVIYAESLCRTDAIECKEYLNCGTSSLGRRLFSSETKIARSPFSYAIFPASHLPAHAFLETHNEDALICARRSYFTIDENQLLITEWYLPALIEKIEQSLTKLS